VTALQLQVLNVCEVSTDHVASLVRALSISVKNHDVGRNLLVLVHFDDVADFKVTPRPHLEALSLLREHYLLHGFVVDIFARFLELLILHDVEQCIEGKTHDKDTLNDGLLLPKTS
jgi:hypothetical protein